MFEFDHVKTFCKPAHIIWISSGLLRGWDSVIIFFLIWSSPDLILKTMQECNPMQSQMTVIFTEWTEDKISD